MKIFFEKFGFGILLILIQITTDLNVWVNGHFEYRNLPYFLGTQVFALFGIAIIISKLIKKKI